MQKISSIPSFLKSSNFSSNMGSCCEEHVGVNAPGSENINTRLSAKRSVEDIDIHALSPSRYHISPVSNSFCDLILNSTVGNLFIIFPYLE